MGVLHRLVERGLAKEGPLGRFQRRPVRQKEKPITAIVEEAFSAATPAHSQANVVSALPGDGTLDKMAALAGDVRTFSQSLLKLADAIDDLAIDIEQRMQSIEADSKRLAQLKALLRGD